MKRAMWQVPVIFAVAAVAIVLGLFSLGLITIAGPGRAMARYHATDVRTEQEVLAWNFDDLGEGDLPGSSEVLSETRFGSWAARAEADAPSSPNALCQTGVGEFPAMALSEVVLGDLHMS